MLNLLLLFQDAAKTDAGIYVPVWLAIIGGLFTVIVPIFTYFSNRPKAAIDLQDAKQKQRRQGIDDELYADKAFEDATVLIEKRNATILELSDKNHDLNMTIQVRDARIKQLEGMHKGALDDRDNLLGRMNQFEKDLAREKEHCSEELEKQNIKIGKMQQALVENNITVSFD